MKNDSLWCNPRSSWQNFSSHTELLSKRNKPLWLETRPYQEFLFIFELVGVPSIVLLRAGNWDSWVGYEPTAFYLPKWNNTVHGSNTALFASRHVPQSIMFPHTLSWHVGSFTVSFLVLSFIIMKCLWVNYIELLRQGRMFRCSNNEVVDLRHSAEFIVFHFYTSVRVKDTICAYNQNHNNKKSLQYEFALSVLSAKYMLYAVNLL